jgi:Domain of unknown function (DUF3859)
VHKLASMLFGAALLWGGAAEAQTVNGANITWYGNYTPGKIKSVPDERTPGGTKDIVTGLTPPTKSTDQIAAVAPSYFGFGYVLVGSPASSLITVRHVRKIPPPGFLNEKTGQPQMVVETTVQTTIGRKDLFIGQAITDADSLPKGPWTFQVWYGDKLLAEKSFAVALPGQSDSPAGGTAPAPSGQGGGSGK